MKRWTKKALEKYCEKVTGFPVKVKFTSLKKLRWWVACAYPGTNEMDFACRKFGKGIIWHECSHLLFNFRTKSRVYRESMTHIRAIQLALDREDFKVVRTLFSHLDDWYRRPYAQARKKVNSYFGRVVV